MSRRPSAPTAPAAKGPPDRLAAAAGHFRPVVLVSLVLIGAAFVVDPAVNRWVTGQQIGPALERVFGRSDTAYPLLDQLFPLLIILAILFSLPHGGLRCAGLLLPILLHLPVLYLLKWGIGRMRPMAELGAYHFAPFSGAKYADAFPSGHTALPAIVALVLALNFPRARWVFYAWAAAEGMKRIVFRWHHLSDVLAGYLLAYLVVWICWRLWGGRVYPPPATNNKS